MPCLSDWCWSAGIRICRDNGGNNLGKSRGSLTAARIAEPWGQALTAADYQGLGARWITPELADDAGLRRVDSALGRQMFARKRGELSGIIIPNVAPWDGSHVREYRLRLDKPD